MKLGYRKDINNWYVPQYLDKESNTWKDIKVKDCSTTLKKLAMNLGEPTRWYIIYHYDIPKGQKEEDMSLIFKYEYKVMAFLAAVQCLYSRKFTEFNFKI